MVAGRGWRRGGWKENTRGTGEIRAGRREEREEYLSLYIAYIHVGRAMGTPTSRRLTVSQAVECIHARGGRGRRGRGERQLSALKAAALKMGPLREGPS